MDSNYLEELFIDEAKPALERWNQSGGGSSAEEWIGDGNTHIWISLPEGRTSPMLGLYFNSAGKVTVDWGDGSTPYTTTVTSLGVTYTPAHEYGKAGNYIITITTKCSISFSGSMLATSPANAYILRHSSDDEDARNSLYLNAVRRVELGNSATVGSFGFYKCNNVTSIKISDGETSIGQNAFRECYGLTDVVIPSSVSYIYYNAFMSCYALTNVTIPDGVSKIESHMFESCRNLRNVTIPNSVTYIQDRAFSECTALDSIVIPDSVTNLGAELFKYCVSLSSIKIPRGVTSIAYSTFAGCTGVAYYDFTEHTAVPTLGNTNAFTGIPADCEIRVPAALVDEWKAATNWSTYAKYIVGV